ncbi:unnamed protein product [Allacma fusca]|uniref:palmitoyl-CoA hydrolase n=1 Tax=Allacma fusca TaxID=39272 RepID=A0A8J2KWA6_9HEXA|nr:unnamed protein product [Allacma fusca]
MGKSETESSKHPGTNVTIIDRLHGWKSITPIWYQINKFSKDLIPIMNSNPNGVHVIGFSQGGLVARGLIQSISNHTVHNFISLSSPQAGQYGGNTIKEFFC